MAPEMLLGDPAALSERTDVFLLGAVFYEMFAGHPPHTGTTMQAMLAEILLSRPRYAGNFPAEARGICEQAMARSPASRHASAEAFRDAVENYMSHRGSRKLAWDAKQSLTALLRTLSDEPPGEERTLAVFNLLGECRFGYRAALSAWPENEAARRGLDRALLGVVEHELSEGDPQAAALLLREISDPPAAVAARVDSAVRARAEQDERLRQLGQDLDPAVGTRTRTFIGVTFGLLWTAAPLVGWADVARGNAPTHAATFGSTVAFLLLGAVFRIWARDTMTKTLINRRLGQTLGLHLTGQLLLAAGAALAGISPTQSQTLHVFTWAVTQTLLAVWVEPCFAVTAAVCAASFLVACAQPTWLYALMALDNLVLTFTLVFVWLPRQDVDRVMKRRADLHSHARRLFLDLSRRQPSGGPPSDGDDVGP
jgi:eukaryotic-like serine/threonine-protein kinase